MVTEINLGGLNINAGECWYPDLVDNLPSFLFITYLMHSKAQKLGSVTGSIEVTHVPIPSSLTPELSHPPPWEHPALERLGTHTHG